MNGEALVQAVIRALVAGVLAAIAVLIPWLSSPDAQAALGSWAIYLPIIVGVLNGIAKAIGGATEPATTNVGRGGAARVRRPNWLSI